MAEELELGLGAREVLSVPGTGRIVGVYSKAAYLRLPAGLVALTTLEVPSGPVHARRSVPLDRLRVDDRVVVTASLLQAGPVLVDLCRAPVWRGPVPTAAGMESGRRLALELIERSPASALHPKVIESVSNRLRKGDIAGVAARLGGLGPGLTPAGDDCLAGIMLIASIRWGEKGSRRLTEVAAMVETNDVSRTFLHWAGLGQSIEPVHRLLVSAAEGDADDAAVAMENLTRFGRSSGADIALGLKLGLDLLS